MSCRTLVCVTAIIVALLGLAGSAGAAQTGGRTAVINGQEAAAGSAPYMAFVVSFEGEGASVCSGTVVSSNVVLTAAHCVMDGTFSTVHPTTSFRVVTGNVDWAASPRTVSTVAQVAVDPGLAYTVPGYLPVRGDAALLQLSSPIAQPPVRLATSQSWTTGTPALLAGWGEATPGGGAVETLRFGEAEVQSPEYCKSKSSHFEPPAALCVQDYPGSTYSVCHGDSGGPLLIFPAGEPLEIGIASYGSETCSPTLPQYYTRVDAIAPWVTQKVVEWAPPSPVPSTAPPALPTPSTATPAPVPEPAPTPTLPIMRRGQAVTYATKALRVGLGWRFSGRVGYRVACTAAPAAKQKCSVSWTRRGTYYAGTVTVFYAFEGGKLVWGDHYRVRAAGQTFRG